MTVFHVVSGDGDVVGFVQLGTEEPTQGELNRAGLEAWHSAHEVGVTLDPSFSRVHDGEGRQPWEMELRGWIRKPIPG